MDFLQQLKAQMGSVWGGKDPSGAPKIGTPPPVSDKQRAPHEVKPGAAEAAAGIHPDHGGKPPSAELDDVKNRIELKRARLLQAQTDGDTFQVEDLQAQLAELEGKYGALGGKSAPMASFAAAGPKPAEEKKPAEDADIAKNRALLAANKEGSSDGSALTPGQMDEMEDHLSRYDQMPGGIAKAEADLPVLEGAAQAANEAENAKRNELAQTQARMSEGESLPYHQRHALELEKLRIEEELKELQAQTQTKLDAYNQRLSEKDGMQQMLDESKAFLENEHKGFDLTTPATPDAAEPFDMDKHHKMLAKQVSGLRDEENGLDAKTDAEFAALSKQIDDPNTSDADRLAARERREMLEALEDRRREELQKQQTDLSADLKGTYDLRRAVDGQKSFEAIAGANQSNDFATSDQVERQLDALREAVAADGGLKSSMGAEHTRLSTAYPDIAASFPRLGYTGDQRRWLEQRIAYLEKRAGELPRKVHVDMRAADDEARKNPPKSEEELAAEQRAQNLELVRALSGPDAKQDPQHYLLGLDKLQEAAATVESAPAQIETQGKSLEDLKAREAELTARCNSSEEHLKHLEAARYSDHDPADVEKRMAEHTAAQKELLEVARKLQAANQSLDELQAKLRAANQELEGPAQFVDITDQRETVGIGDTRLEDARKVLFDAMRVDFGKERPAEGDRLLNDIVERAKPAVSLFLDPTKMPKPGSLEEVNLFLAEYQKRMLIHQTLGEPAREKMQGMSGEKVWHDRNGQPAVTAEMFGPEFGLSPGQALAMQDEIRKLLALRGQLDGSDAKAEELEADAEAEKQAVADKKFDEFAEGHDTDLVGRYNIVLGRLNEDKALDQVQMNGDDILAHMNMGAAVQGLKGQLMDLSGKLKRARREGKPTDDLVAQRHKLLEEARKLQQEYVKKGDAMIARAAELARELPDELKAHLTAKGQADDRKGFEGVIKQIEQDEKLEAVPPR